MKIKELKKKYKDEWLAIEVTKEENGRSVEGRLILHEKDRDILWEKLSSLKKTNKKEDIYVTYTGPLLKKGYAAAF